MENYYSCTLYNNERTCRVLAGNGAAEELPFPILIRVTTIYKYICLKTNSYVFTRYKYTIYF